MTGCTTLKSLHVQHVPTHRVHILLSSAQYNKHDSTYLQRTKPNIEACFDLLAEEGNAGRVSPSILWRRNRWRQLPPRACKPSSEIFWTGSTNTANSATLNHQASKDVCSYLISALKDEVPFETANNTQTMAVAKAAIRTSRDSLHDQQQPNAPFYSGFIISSFLKMSSTRQARPVTCSRKEELIPPSLSRPTPTLLSFCGFMRWSSWKRSQGRTAKPCRKPRQEIRKVLCRNFKLHEVQDEHVLQLYEAHIYA